MEPGVFFTDFETYREIFIETTVTYDADQMSVARFLRKNEKESSQILELYSSKD